MFICDEGVLVIRVLVLNMGSNTSAKKMIIDYIAFEYYDNILNHPKFYGSKHMYVPTQVNYACFIIGGPTKWVDLQKV